MGLIGYSVHSNQMLIIVSPVFKMMSLWLIDYLLVCRLITWLEIVLISFETTSWAIGEFRNSVEGQETWNLFLSLFYVDPVASWIPSWSLYKCTFLPIIVSTQFKQLRSTWNCYYNRSTIKNGVPTSESQYFPLCSFFTSSHATVCGVGSGGKVPVVMVSKW